MNPFVLLTTLFAFSIGGAYASSYTPRKEVANVTAAARYDFEDSVTWAYNGDSTLSYGTNGYSKDTSEYHKGSTSAKIIRHSNEQTNIFYTSETISLSAGLYDVSFWIKSVDCTPGSRVSLDVTNGTSSLEGRRLVLNASASLSEWTRVNTRMEITSAFATCRPYFLFTSGRGTIYLDDIEFTPVNEDLVSAITHFEADSDGNHNSFNLVNGKYVHKITELDQYDYYALSATYSGSATLNFYDFNGDLIPGSLTKTNGASLYFQAPSANYGLLTMDSLPSSYSLERVGKGDVVDPLSFSTNGGFSVLQNDFSRGGEAYFVSKENCTSWQYKNFYYSTLSSRFLPLSTEKEYTFTYYVYLKNASSDFVLNSLMLERSDYASGDGEVYTRYFTDTVDGISVNQIGASYADGNWHKVVKSFTPSNEVYFQFYWQVLSGSADFYIANLTISEKPLNVTFELTFDSPTYNQHENYSFTPLATETTSEIVDSTLYVNGVKTSPILYLEPTENPYHAANCNYNMANSNFELYSTYYGRLDRMWQSDGSIDYEDFDHSIRSFLHNGPQVRVMVHFALFAPTWWLEENPDEEALIYTDASTSAGAGGVSFSSSKFIADAKVVLQQIIAHMKSMDYWNSIFAFKLSAGRTFEWMTFGMGSDQSNHLGDYSPCAIKGFRSYLEERYSTIASLNSAYGTSYSSFSEINPPSWNERTSYDASLYKERKYVDWNLYFNDASAEMFISFATYLKQLTSSNKIVGGYFGYLWYTNSYNSIGTAHTALEKVLASSSIDFIASPVGYGERYLGQGISMMSLNDTIRAYGKLYLLEQDNRTSMLYRYGVNEVISNHNALGFGWTNEDALHFLKADFCADFVTGAGLWYYDMTGNWFDNDEYYHLFNKEKEEMDHSLTINESEDFLNDVAVFVDDETYAYIVANDTHGASPFLCSIYSEQRKALAAIGTGYDVYSMSTLVAGKVPAHKVNLLLGTIVMDEAEVSAVNTYLKKDNQFVVYVGPCGYGNGSSFSVDNISKATGLTVKEYTKSIVSQVEITNSSIASDLTYGATSNTFELATYVKNATEWGLLEGTTTSSLFGTTKYVGLAYQDNSTYKTVYSSCGNLPAEVLRYVLNEAGVHQYSNDYSDVIYSNDNYVALHSGTAGNKTISLPGNYAVYDVFAGTYVANNTNEISFFLEANDTKLYRLETALSDDEAVVRDYINAYLHLDDYCEDLGYCADQTHHYYQDAKTALASLSDAQRLLLATDSRYASAYARLQAWARANGETLTITSIGALNSVSASAITIDDTEVSVTLIVTLSSAFLLALSIFFFASRKKKNGEE